MANPAGFSGKFCVALAEEDFVVHAEAGGVESPGHRSPFRRAFPNTLVTFNAWVALHSTTTE